MTERIVELLTRAKAAVQHLRRPAEHLAIGLAASILYAYHVQIEEALKAVLPAEVTRLILASPFEGLHAWAGIAGSAVASGLTVVIIAVTPWLRAYGIGAPKVPDLIAALRSHNPALILAALRALNDSLDLTDATADTDVDAAVEAAATVPGAGEDNEGDVATSEDATK